MNSYIIDPKRILTLLISIWLFLVSNSIIGSAYTEKNNLAIPSCDNNLSRFYDPKDLDHLIHETIKIFGLSTDGTIVTIYRTKDKLIAAIKDQTAGESGRSEFLFLFEKGGVRDMMDFEEHSYLVLISEVFYSADYTHKERYIQATKQESFVVCNPKIFPPTGIHSLIHSRERAFKILEEDITELKLTQ